MHNIEDIDRLVNKISGIDTTPVELKESVDALKGIEGAREYLADILKTYDGRGEIELLMRISKAATALGEIGAPDDAKHLNGVLEKVIERRLCLASLDKTMNNIGLIYDLIEAYKSKNNSNGDRTAGEALSDDYVNKLSEKLGDGKYFQLNGQYNEFNKVVVDSLGDYIVEAMIKLGAISQVISTIDKISEFEMNDSMKNDLGDLCAKLQEKLKGVYSGKREKMDLLHKDNEGKKYDMLIDARCTFERYESKINNIEKKLHQNKNPTRGKPNLLF